MAWKFGKAIPGFALNIPEVRVYILCNVRTGIVIDRPQSPLPKALQVLRHLA